MADIREIGKIVRDANVLCHTDATQAVVHMKIDVQKLNIDLMLFSSSRFMAQRASMPYMFTV